MSCRRERCRWSRAACRECGEAMRQECRHHGRSNNAKLDKEYNTDSCLLSK